MSAIPPFSARNRGAQPQIDNDFPESARIGLIHLIDRLVSKRYVEDWQAINGELKRIARVLPGMKMNADELLLLQQIILNPSITQAKQNDDGNSPAST